MVMECILRSLVRDCGVSGVPGGFMDSVEYFIVGILWLRTS